MHNCLGFDEGHGPFFGNSFLLVCFVLPSSEQCYSFLMPPALHAQNLEGWLFFFYFSACHCTELSPVSV